MGTGIATVLFACVHNAGRSQMAAAWFNHLAAGSIARGISAGTEPGARLHPEVLAAMLEVGIDLSAGTPRLLSEELARSASFLVTMGCGERCPVVPGLKREDWPLEDPKGKPLERVREIRDEIRGRVVELLGRWPVSFEAATAADLGGVLALLRAEKLPTAGVEDQFPFAYAVARRNGDLVGVAGLEVYASVGLLRSVAVQAKLRGQAIGRHLVEERLRAAEVQGLSAVYILTTTAADFFHRFCFVDAERSQVPAELAASPEFAVVCPASAACLVRWLR